MKKLLHTLLFVFSTFCIHSQLCSTETDFNFCYEGESDNLVAFEVCSDNIATASICQGFFETGYDNLTVYEGLTGSGTGGEIVFGPADGFVGGNSLVTTTEGNCLIFVINSDYSISCSEYLLTELQVNISFCPNEYFCYSNDEENTVVLELCGAENEIIDALLCNGSIEPDFDNLTVYEGESGSGTMGEIVLGPIDGILEGTTLSSSNEGNCLIFVMNSDGSVSCQDSDEIPFNVAYQFSTVISTFSTELSEDIIHIEKMFPNPTSDVINIQFDSKIQGIIKLND